MRRARDLRLGLLAVRWLRLKPNDKGKQLVKMNNRLEQLERRYEAVIAEAVAWEQEAQHGNGLH
eukprot:scaffold8828_cov204-Amphora_coffeaeformis.AAC.17